MKAIVAVEMVNILEEKRTENAKQFLAFARANDDTLNAMTDCEFDAIANEAMRQCGIDSESGMRELFQCLKPKVEVRMLN